MQLSIRDYLRRLVRAMHVSKETGNREGYMNAREEFRTYWRKRNAGRKMFTNRV